MKTSQTVLRVGVTGGIGSGKSTVCRLFSELGRAVISADDLGRDLTDSKSEIKSSIREVFGETVFLQNGNIDRAVLGKLVFSNDSLREKLNNIVHPHVFDAIEASIGELPPARQLPYIIIEAALIFESGMDERLDYTIVVHADEDVRIERVMNRDKLTREEVLSRLKSQMDPNAKSELADFVLLNNGPESELLASVKFFDMLIARLSPTTSLEI